MWHLEIADCDLLVKVETVADTLSVVLFTTAETVKLYPIPGVRFKITVD